MDLNAIFGKFAGQHLRNPERLTCDMDDVLTNLENTARQNGLALRVKWEGMMHDQSYDATRVNVNVETINNKIIIKPDFHIG